MPPFGTLSPVSPVPPTDPGGASAFSAQPPPPDSGLVAARDAFSSAAGVTVRLLASLPANLGQNLDAAV